MVADGFVRSRKGLTLGRAKRNGGSKPRPPVLHGDLALREIGGTMIRSALGMKSPRDEPNVFVVIEHGSEPDVLPQRDSVGGLSSRSTRAKSHPRNQAHPRDDPSTVRERTMPSLRGERAKERGHSLGTTRSVLGPFPEDRSETRTSPQESACGWLGDRERRGWGPKPRTARRLPHLGRFPR